MAELASDLAGKVLGLLASKAIDEITQAWGARKGLEKLKLTMVSIAAVLLDAEEKQLHNMAISLWLDQLKSVLYDAEDLLSDFQARHLKKQVLLGFRNKVSRFFSISNSILFWSKMGHGVREIQERLDEIAKTRRDFGLVEREQTDHPLGNREREMTHSFVPAADIIGREEAKEIVIRYLKRHVDNTNVSVVPIVGMGGLGKTALAKLVYNDDWAKTFGKKLWVCVSNDFDLKKVIVQAIKCATGKDLGNMDIEQLQQRLREIVGGKRYLLVLDDVWDEDGRKWQELKALLAGGAQGSKVIVTTRSDRVASIVGTIEAPYKMKELSHEHCLNLFFRCAFGEGEQREWPALRKIGEEIVTKCKGVPLAVMTLGSLLRFKTDEAEWKSVRESELWKLRGQKENDIMPALMLSYERLPSHLKPCFAYCSIFPKDFQLYDFQLTEFWMALDLLKPSYAGQNLEDVGRSYFNELASKGVFQDVDDTVFGKSCKLHDLVHDLALSVLGDEIFDTASNVKELPNPKKVRYLCGESTSPDLPAMVQSLKQIRMASFGQGTSISLIETCLPKFRYLRFLWLSYLNFAPPLEGIFSNSQHLRLLILQYNMETRHLPSSICELHSLQYLDLSECYNLEELPKNIKYLVSLRCLFVTLKQVRLPNEGIGALKSLRFLWFGGCKNMEHLCEDIQGLQNLKQLSIYSCPRLKCLPHGVKLLRALEALVISDCDEIDLRLEEGEGSNRDTTSHCRIQGLFLGKLPKLEELPQWVVQGSTDTLQDLVIGRCSNMKKMSNDLHKLHVLQRVRVFGCPNALNRGRCTRETGEDWHKISHIPNIFIDTHLV